MRLNRYFYVALIGSTPAWAVATAAVFVIVTLCLSVYLLLQHLSAYKNPEEQKFLIGVILMVPFYSIESYVSLVNPSISVDCGILRDCYESFAMYCFGRYLIACLGGEERTIEFMNRQGGSSSSVPLLEHDSEKGVIKHPFPMNYILKPWKLGEWFYQLVKFGIVQYMIIKTFTAVLAFILEAFGVYCEGEFKWGCGYPYLAVVLNFSQSWALYCLVQFYAATKDELAHIKPLAKFLVFKSIVFLTWWQGVAIALLYTWGLLKSPIAQGLQFKSSIQNFFICIEGTGKFLGHVFELEPFHTADYDQSFNREGNIYPITIIILLILQFKMPIPEKLMLRPAQMGIASIIHLYVFPTKPYELMGDRFPGSVSVLGDYASVDSPLDPDEVRESERPTKLRLPRPDIDTNSGMTFRESVRDVVLGGGEFIVNDLKFTVTHAVEPVEKGFTRFNEKLHKISENIKKHEKRRAKDDSCIGSSSYARGVIRGIDDPLLNGSATDTAHSRGRRHRAKSGYTSAGSGGDSSDPSRSGFAVRGCRWVTKD